MLTGRTAKRMTALIAALAAVLATGCGGGSSTATSSAGAGKTSAPATSTGATPGASANAEIAQACRSASQAQRQYRTATAKAGLNFKDRALMTSSDRGAAQLRARVQQLRQADQRRAGEPSSTR